MKKGFLVVFPLIISMVSLSGCIVRVYEKEMPREDIVVSGNQGYIIGGPPKQSYVVKKKTRKIIVTEIELVNPKKIELKTEPPKSYKKKDSSSAEKNNNYGYIYKKEQKHRDLQEDLARLGQEPAEESVLEERQESKYELDSEQMEPNSSDIQQGSNKRFVYKTYKVQKGDTLQKISYKFYGKYSLWPRIFEANKDKLENPNSIYVGQELRIPVLEESK